MHRSFEKKQKKKQWILLDKHKKQNEIVKLYYLI